ncbi:hypothetical protein AB205_0136180 [Aquarana catesbeiana]|uniref:Uncharacterized protein n=1 Tax=Aquarana catesbeiana TaxID=8400 RepID=A0A2G9QCK8_AQUCT|nr:hypothetical protein AB205_0136180 [Aquarana catesbeiana]
MVCAYTCPVQYMEFTGKSKFKFFSSCIFCTLLATIGCLVFSPVYNFSYNCSCFHCPCPYPEIRGIIDKDKEGKAYIHSILHCC